MLCFDRNDRQRQFNTYSDIFNELICIFTHIFKLFCHFSYFILFVPIWNQLSIFIVCITMTSNRHARRRGTTRTWTRPRLWCSTARASMNRCRRTGRRDSSTATCRPSLITTAVWPTCRRWATCSTSRWRTGATPTSTSPTGWWCRRVPPAGAGRTRSCLRSARRRPWFGRSAIVTPRGGGSDTSWN